MTLVGEVGVDIDADHGVMDIVTLDSMIKRLGRVNRMGLMKAKVGIVFTKKEAEGPEQDLPKTHGFKGFLSFRPRLCEVSTGKPSK